MEGETERCGGQGREVGTSRPKELGWKLAGLELKKNGISRISENEISRSNTGIQKRSGYRTNRFRPVFEFDIPYFVLIPNLSENMITSR